MMQVPRTTTSRKYPKFIRDNDALKKYSKQQTIFPKIGLDNCEVDISGTFNKIIFSGSGNKALWDIATMSMRGINSCQRWTHDYARRLIGSMIDPYTAIIYITDSENTNLGSRMIKRSIVRFVVNNKTKKPAILLERIYPVINDQWVGEVFDADTFDIFKNFLKEKTNNKFSIVRSKRNHFIPLTEPVLSLKKKFRSYRDSKITYKASPIYNDISNVNI